MTVELNVGDITNLKVLAKRQACEALRFSKDVGFSETVRGYFREDFHRFFNLYKKLDSSYKNFMESL